MDIDDVGYRRCEGNKVILKNINSLITDRIKDGDIPHWLLVEVLIRLPTKSVFRCKLVSKEWLSVILDPYFVRLYCSRASLFPRYQRWTLLRSHMYWNDSERPHFLDYDMFEDIYSSIKRPSLYPLSFPCRKELPHDKRYKICGVSNGLVVYKFTEGDRYDTNNFRICNPLTGQWIAFPPHITDVNDVAGRGFVANVEDGVLLSFTVVLLHGYGIPTKLTSCEVFFSETGEWKMYDVHIDKPVKMYLKGLSTVLNGIIHWLLRELVLFAYDPCKSPDQARIIALPEADFPSKHFCSAYQGQLRYIRVSNDFVDHFTLLSINIWVMNDYSSGVWCLQHRVSHADIQPSDIISRRYLCFKPISFHPYDSDIVYLRFFGVLFSYNIKTRTLEVEEDFYYTKGGARGKIYSLLIPPWPVIPLFKPETERID